MEPTSLIIGAAVGAGALHFLGGKKKATPRKRSTTAKKKAVPVKKAVAKKPVAKKAVAKSKPASKKKVGSKPKVVSAKNRQTGSSKRTQDKTHQAMKPGKRISANGNVYYERRANRSDVGKLLGTEKKK